MCSLDPISRTDKESSIWCQNDRRDVMQNLSAPFIFREECRVKIEHVLFSSVFSGLRIRVSEAHFQCVHAIRFSEPTKIGSSLPNKFSMSISGSKGPVKLIQRVKIALRFYNLCQICSTLSFLACLSSSTYD